MFVRITGGCREITGAINAFSHAYHADFSKVRAIGHRYLAEAFPMDDLAADLAAVLRSVLRGWGAGKRGAPELRRVEEFAETFRLTEIHASLAALGSTPLSNLSVTNGRRFFNGRQATPKELAAFDVSLFGVLRALADRLFIGNTNATYPMKTVLLITGLMPALDSQVRCGLQRGGFLGMDKTQYLLPADASRADGKKIARLPFVLGECWASCAQQLREGIVNSSFSDLLSEPGRVFDVLLFMQGDQSNRVLVTCDPPARRWYDLA